jgi:hypothetical protein
MLAATITHRPAIHGGAADLDADGAGASRSTWQPGQLSGAGFGAGLYLILVQLSSTQCNDLEIYIFVKLQALFCKMLDGAA